MADCANTTIKPRGASAPEATRRALITGAGALTLIATVAPSAAAAKRSAFVQEIGALHPRGAFVARRALDLGADPDLCSGVTLYALGYEHDVPRLYFGVAGKPRQKITVTPLTAYVEGPVPL